METLAIYIPLIVVGLIMQVAIILYFTEPKKR